MDSTQINNSNTLEALDCINRQAAIDAICTDCCGGNRDHDCRFYPDCDNLKSIKALPPVQPNHGKWIERNPLNSNKCRLIECDQCGNSYIVGFNVPYEHWTDNRNYCEKCGADMRGEAE